MSGILSSLGVHWMSLLAQAVNFGILAFVLYKFVIKPALASLDARVKRQEEMEKGASNIDAKLREIEDSREAVLAEARTESKRLISETESAAKRLEEKLKADAEAAAAGILSAAKAQIESERNALYADIKKDIASLVAAGIEKTVGRYVDAGMQKKMTDEAVNQISSK